MSRTYNDKMSAEEQIGMEEDIAAMIFSHCDVDVDEETASDLGRQILIKVLWEFRPDLFLTDEEENPRA